MSGSKEELSSRPSEPLPQDDAIFSKNTDLDEGFSQHFSHDSDEEMNLTITDTRQNLSFALPGKQFTKLEVVRARQIENILRIHHAAIGIGVIYTLVMVILSNTAYLEYWSVPVNGIKYEFRRFKAPDGLISFDQIVSVLFFFYGVLLCIIFTTRILRMKSTSRTKEQIWVILLLFSMVLFLNPAQAIINIRDELIFKNRKLDRWIDQPWADSFLKVFMILKTSGFASGTVFYIWANMHSYRFFDTKITYRFYLPKVILLAIYIIAKIIAIQSYSVFPAELLYANFIAMLSVYNALEHWHKPGVIYACFTLVMDTVFVVLIVLEYLKTRQALKNADYLQYRSKQIGFRFFLYHNLTFYLVFTIIYIILLTGLPNGLTLFSFMLRGISYLTTQQMSIGLQLLLLTYSTMEAYVTLPADALGWKGWFAPQVPKGKGATAAELEPITYRKREPPSFNGVVSDLRVNCFVMQTHVTLFNFAWLVYYWDTPKVENFKLTQDVFQFTIAEYIKDKETDTHVLVVDGEDRIVIAFKGTTSTRNLRTDINMLYSTARSLLPTQLGEMDEIGDSSARKNPLLRTHVWRRAKVHKGFATAYRAVGPQLLTTVKRLQDEKKRPVFLTGHSLGGALATICSLDLFLRLKLSRKDIFVSTFGAPRVGNRHFWNFYNVNVPIHWRIVVGPDVVAKLPKIGFIHVGKKVLLTVNGDLFIDPNSLELNLWSGDAASILYHRKASYLLAMRAWCERHHGDEYLPEFWPFPVSQDDTRRFQHAMVKSVRSGMYGSPRPMYNKREKIMMLDAVIEALGDGPDLNPNITERWVRLTRAILDQDDNVYGFVENESWTTDNA